MTTYDHSSYWIKGIKGVLVVSFSQFPLEQHIYSWMWFPLRLGYGLKKLLKVESPHLCVGKCLHMLDYF